MEGEKLESETIEQFYLDIESLKNKYKLAGAAVLQRIDEGEGDL